ncbi:MAG TPA: SDR family oxidoreductase [Pseudomonadales bacterium]
MQNLFRLDGKKALITGGCRGIGRMMAEGLLQAGAEVWVTGRDAGFVHQAVADMCRLGPCHGIVAELDNQAGIQALADTVLAAAPDLHILINNAAQYQVAPLLDTDYDSFNHMLQVNLTAAFELSRLLLPALQQTSQPLDPARIIHIGSNVALSHSAWHSWAYSSAKHALHHLAVMMASDLTSQGVNVNAIAPGTFDTRMIDGWRADDGSFDAEAAGMPMKRLGQADDIQGVITLLCSRAGAFIAGAVIPVEGASMLRPMA